MIRKSYVSCTFILLNLEGQAACKNYDRELRKILAVKTKNVRLNINHRCSENCYFEMR